MTFLTNHDSHFCHQPLLLELSYHTFRGQTAAFMLMVDATALAVLVETEALGNRVSSS